MLRFFTFGGLLIERDGEPLQLPTQKARDLVAYLLTFRHRRHPRAVLAGVLWPDLPEERARRRLSDTLWRVRRALSECIVADKETVWFRTDTGYWLDVEQFQQVLTDLRLERADLKVVEEAIALYQGPYLEGLYYDWVLLERERLHSLYLEALERLLDFYKGVGEYEAALDVARRLVAVEPFQEAAHRELMRLYYLLGRNAEALAQYHRCREILQEELGVAPAPETETLYQILLRQSPPGQEAGPPEPHVPFPAHRPPLDLGAPPLVGREAERAMLLAHLEAAAAGRGGIVLVEGEPGIGKTRLAEEVVAGARWRNIRVVVARAEEKEGASYGLLTAALTPLLTPLRIRQLARLVEPEHLRAALPLFPAIGRVLVDLPPLPAPPLPEARQRLHRALVALILGLSRIAPHFWVLEDLQWADVETLALLPLLLPHLSTSRTLFLLTGRSAELRASPTVWKTLQELDRVGPFSRYVLDRLNAEEVAQMVRHLLGEDCPALSDHLMRESDGVPLYLVEILKAWRDEGCLRPTERGTWAWVGGEPEALAVRPGEAVIAHRLSRLTPAAGELLNIAAVIGTEVDFDLLAAVCAMPLSDLDLTSSDVYLEASDELLRLGLLVETETGYRFSHDRVRRLVYRGLSPSKRQRFHHRVAREMEALFPERYESLAHHFAAAGERQPTIHYLLRAVRRAREVFAHDAALESYGRLLDLLTHPEDRPTRFDVLRDRTEVLGWIGDREAQGRDLEEMLSLAHALSDDARLACALHLRSEWHRVQGRYEPANKDARAALEIYRRLGDQHGQAAILSQLGWNAIYTANPTQAADDLQEALSIYQALDDPEGQVHCLIGLSSVAANLDGDYVRSLSYGQQCLALAQRTSDPRLRARALFNLALNYFDLGDAEAARKYLYQALQIEEMTHDRRRQAATHFYLGAMVTECNGDLDAARVHLDTALEIFREVQDLSWEGDTLAALGRLALLQGDPVTAATHLKAAYQRRRELDEPGYAVVDLSYLALAELALGREDDAWRHSQEAVAELEAGLMGVEHPYRLYYNHYRVAEATRRWAAARAALARAGEIIAECAERIHDLALQEQFCTRFRVCRAVTDALADQPPPGQLRVRLPRADATGRGRGSPRATIAVIWTVDAGEEDAALLAREGKVVLRRHRILRLLAEAEAAGALPTVADLAGALEVSPRTIRADLAALRRQGHPVRTCGRPPC